ncbi:SDR family oxidoreductase [Microbacterium arabinogalactanolyticum]|uniref:SDR family oxidoreductase n=1 Tax=Microbacterium arabinogalactanolyticum TaxID=69365 RepID=UPI00255384B7|nr:SDR family oxidoreductase [Microbacterium arabinogalactanolyticum]GLC84555.1 short chain dehydrogenase [Microbacterium arabinogalactanolyticum]
MTTTSTALVTGATSGIGRAIAAALAATHHVHLIGRNRGALGELAAALPSAEVHPADLADGTQISGIAEEIDRLDVLVHSAGVLHMGSTEDLDPAQWRESLEVNVLAPVELTRVLLPALRRASGQVILINSGLGHRSIAGSGAYSASKFALRAFADALRQEEAENGVRVTSIHPGRVATPMQEQLRAWEGLPYDGDAWIRPEQVADAVLTAVNLDRNAVIGTLDISPAPRPRSDR